MNLTISERELLALYEARDILNDLIEKSPNKDAVKRLIETHKHIKALTTKAEAHHHEKARKQN